MSDLGWAMTRNATKQTRVEGLVGILEITTTTTTTITPTTATTSIRLETNQIVVVEEAVAKAVETVVGEEAVAKGMAVVNEEVAETVAGVAEEGPRDVEEDVGEAEEGVDKTEIQTLQDWVELFC